MDLRKERENIISILNKEEKLNIDINNALRESNKKIHELVGALKLLNGLLEQQGKEELETKKESKKIIKN